MLTDEQWLYIRSEASYLFLTPLINNDLAEARGDRFLFYTDIPCKIPYFEINYSVCQYLKFNVSFMKYTISAAWLHTGENSVVLFASACLDKNLNVHENQYYWFHLLFNYYQYCICYYIIKNANLLNKQIFHIILWNLGIQSII